MGSDFTLEGKDEARAYFNQLRQKFIDWNYSEWMSDAFKQNEADIKNLYASKNGTLSKEAEMLLKDGE